MGDSGVCVVRVTRAGCVVAPRGPEAVLGSICVSGSPLSAAQPLRAGLGLMAAPRDYISQRAPRSSGLCPQLLGRGAGPGRR